MTDAVLEPLERQSLIRSSLGSSRVRRTAVALVGAVLLVIFVIRLSGPRIDEMPLAALVLWGSIVAGGAYVAGLRSPARDVRP